MSGESRLARHNAHSTWETSILILFVPRLLNYIVALDLIITGILGRVGGFAGGTHI
ncbi:MAG TPA: DUF3096 domain-containing protein [Burkholderiales bacterium]|nr:DUF3096 domain-containing protein [Burkholderiales bacterium]